MIAKARKSKIGKAVYLGLFEQNRNGGKILT